MPAAVPRLWRAITANSQDLAEVTDLIDVAATSDDMVQLSALDIFSSARTLRASVYGSSDPDVEVPQLAQDVLSGALKLDHLVTDRIGLADIPAAFDRMARGEGARSVVTF